MPKTTEQYIKKAEKLVADPSPGLISTERHRHHVESLAAAQVYATLAVAVKGTDD